MWRTICDESPIRGYYSKISPDPMPNHAFERTTAAYELQQLLLDTDHITEFLDELTREEIVTRIGGEPPDPGAPFAKPAGPS